MAGDLFTDLSQQVALVLPPLIEDPYSTSLTDRSIILPSDDIEGKEPLEEQSNSGASLDHATSQVTFIATIIKSYTLCILISGYSLILIIANE